MPNRLSQETSPYLLQHQENPVDWYPWCDEALDKARSEEKPIFLSIGYSACHWCHVMEHESFENPQIAEYLNSHFVNIKVDREERPDLDQIYMQAVMAMNGHGGWPLSAFLTPDQDFFFGGTYWPPTTTASMPGFDRVLSSVLDAWHQRREQVLAQSRQITDMINATIADGRSEFDEKLFQDFATTLHNQFDNTFGGFGSAPKFPHPMDLSLLLTLYSNQFRNPQSQWDSPKPTEILEMVEVTLSRMAHGGIYDHLAGGFARYSVDARWLVPHFEKMLYDNALLVRVYLKAFQVTDEPFYARVAKETLDYLLDYMTDPLGAFYSTEDADSEGVEGKFYVWSFEEIFEVLGQDVGQRFCQLYGVTSAGNFEGANILNLSSSATEYAAEHELVESEFLKEMRNARRKLLEVRDQRIRPGLDDKVLTNWNALAIQAFAEAANILDNGDYARAARNAAEFLWTNLRNQEGRLLHTWRNGHAKLGAYLDDYAYLINALVSLYRVQFEERWVARAVELSEVMIDQFHNPENGAFFFTARDHESLIARTQEFQDTAVPSGNAMAAIGLIRLGRLTNNQRFVNTGHTTALAATSLLQRAPNAASQSLEALENYLRKDQHYLLYLGRNESENRRAIRWVQVNIDLDTAAVVCSPDSNHELFNIDPINESSGRITLIICRDQHCESPVYGIEKIETLAGSQG